MKEIREIIKAFDDCAAAGKKAALASVVHLNGSSYRRPGARMLVDDEGRLTGAISGGCLEGDALRKALLVIAQQQSKLVTYDTSDEEDMTVGVQLGCEGVIQVLFEPVDAGLALNPVHLLRKAVAKRQKSVLVTLFSAGEKHKPQTDACLLMEEDGTITGDIPVAAIKDAVMKDVREAMETGVSLFRNYTAADTSITAFIECLQPAISLVVVGAGNDAVPLVNMADILGWEARVVDGRNTHAKPERFAAACQVLVSKPEQALDQITIDGQTAFVLMTHNYNYDLAMLKALLQRNTAYIGVLGPKKKLERMLGELKEQGVTPTEKQLSCIYGPTGLEIGAETAEEIALSIAAEIKAVFAGRQGGPLRDNKGFIHARIQNG
jgi:xanthine dehydrogenase accessory factor